MGTKLNLAPLLDFITEYTLEGGKLHIEEISRDLRKIAVNLSILSMKDNVTYTIDQITTLDMLADAFDRIEKC